MSSHDFRLLLTWRRRRASPVIRKILDCGCDEGSQQKCRSVSRGTLSEVEQAEVYLYLTKIRSAAEMILGATFTLAYTQRVA